jgi:hypothetical protein
MAFKLYKGRTKIVYANIAGSVAVVDGAIVALSSGTIIAATSSTTKHFGICRKTIATTDVDYTSVKYNIPVEVPVEEGVEFLALTTGTTYVAGDACDLTDSVTVNRAANSHKVVTIVKVIDSTHSTIIINSNLSTTDGS